MFNQPNSYVSFIVGNLTILNQPNSYANSYVSFIVGNLTILNQPNSYASFLAD